MAFKINTSRLNDALRMLANFYMQNKLYEMSSQRQMGYLSEQDRLIRERQAEEDVRSRQANVQKYNLDLKLAGEKGIITALGDSNVKGLVQAAKIAANQGDMKRAKSFLQSFEESSKPFVKMAIQARTGETPDEATVAKAMEAADPAQVIDLIKEGGTESRFARKLPIEEKEAGTSRMQAGLAREKFEAEKGPGGRKIDTKLYDAITDVLNYLEPVARDEIHIYREPAQYLSGQLAKIQMKVGAGEEITPDDRGIISEARELKKMAGKYLGKTLPGQERYLQGKEEERKAEAALTEQTKASLIRPEAQVPAPTTLPTIRKYIKDLRTGEEYWIILRNGQWMRE